MLLYRCVFIFSCHLFLFFFYFLFFFIHCPLILISLMMATTTTATAMTIVTVLWCDSHTNMHTCSFHVLRLTFFSFRFCRAHSAAHKIKFNANDMTYNLFARSFLFEHQSLKWNVFFSFIALLLPLLSMCVWVCVCFKFKDSILNDENVIVAAIYLWFKI